MSLCFLSKEASTMTRDTALWGGSSCLCIPLSSIFAPLWKSVFFMFLVTQGFPHIFTELTPATTLSVRCVIWRTCLSSLRIFVFWRYWRVHNRGQTFLYFSYIFRVKLIPHSTCSNAQGRWGNAEISTLVPLPTFEACSTPVVSENRNLWRADRNTSPFVPEQF